MMVYPAIFMDNGKLEITAHFECFALGMKPTAIGAKLRMNGDSMAGH